MIDVVHPQQVTLRNSPALITRVCSPYSPYPFLPVFPICHNSAPGTPEVGKIQTPSTAFSFPGDTCTPWGWFNLGTLGPFKTKAGHSPYQPPNPKTTPVNPAPPVSLLQGRHRPFSFLETLKQWFSACGPHTSNTFEMQILRSYPRPTESETLGLRPNDLVLTSLPGNSNVCKRFENHCSRRESFRDI